MGERLRFCHESMQMLSQLLLPVGLGRIELPPHAPHACRLPLSDSPMFPFIIQELLPHSLQELYTFLVFSEKISKGLAPWLP